jgi:hypothetical protein
MWLRPEFATGHSPAGRRLPQTLKFIQNAPSFDGPRLARRLALSSRTTGPQSLCGNRRAPASLSPGQLIVSSLLGRADRSADLLALADTLPDGDTSLAKALRSTPVALGFVLDPDMSKPVAGVPIATRGPLPIASTSLREERVTGNTISTAGFNLLREERVTCNTSSSLSDHSRNRHARQWTLYCRAAAAL